ncbi:MAG: hypothetical protein AB1705_15445 [Verrucomicrobiota bacterium]
MNPPAMTGAAEQWKQVGAALGYALRRFNLSKTERQVAEIILEYSFECGRAKAWIPNLKYFCQRTGLSKGKVCEQISRLRRKGVLERVDTERGVYALVPDPTLWRGVISHFEWTREMLQLHDWLCRLDPEEGELLPDAPGIGDAVREMAAEQFQPTRGPVTGAACPGQATADAPERGSSGGSAGPGDASAEHGSTLKRPAEADKPAPGAAVSARAPGAYRRLAQDMREAVAASGVPESGTLPNREQTAAAAGRSRIGNDALPPIKSGQSPPIPESGTATGTGTSVNRFFEEAVNVETVPDLLKRCRELFGPEEMKQWGKLWAKRAHHEPGKLERVLNAVEMDMRERGVGPKGVRSVPRHAMDLWKRFAP